MDGGDHADGHPGVGEQGARERELYLPAGLWLDYRDGRTLHAGGRTIRVEAPLSSIPVFVKEGGIVVRGDVLRANNTWSPSWAPRLRVEIFPSPRVASAFSYYTGGSSRTIASRPTASGLRVEVDDLDAATQLAIHGGPPDAVMSSGRRLREGQGYVYDGARRVLETIERIALRAQRAPKP